jgi:general secretion pathway protein D
MENKVPLRGDIPGLGYLFKSETKNQQKTELLVVMTPHIVQNSADLSRSTRSENAKLEITPNSFEKGELKRSDGLP